MEARRRGRTINIMAAALVLAVGSGVGLIVFLVMRTNADVALRRSLVSALALREEWVARDLHAGRARIRMVATRPFLAHQLAMADRGRPDTHYAQVVRGLTAFRAIGLSALALYTAKGRLFAEAGAFMAHPVLAVPLRHELGTTLLWNPRQRFVVRAVLPMYRRHAVVGWVAGDAPLPDVEQLLRSAKRLRAAADLALCGPRVTAMSCFPDTFAPTLAFPRMARRYQGQPLPMSYALAGHKGYVIARNYLGSRVAAAYEPVGDTGLGMALTMNFAALYAPIYREFALALPLIIGVVGGALLLLRWQLAPLVQALVESERRAREAHVRLGESQNYMQAVLRDVDEGITTISESGIVETFNPGMERLFGYRAAEVIGRNISMLMPEPYRSAHDDYLRRYRETGVAHVIGGAGRELVAQRKDGQEFPMDLHVSEFFVEGRRRFIGTIRDATGRKEAERRMEHRATHDALTDLPGRVLINTRTEQLIRRAERSGQLFAVMFLDLDGFKGINDRLGHAAGDQLLRMVADRLKETLRVEDMVGRLGGDEFVVLVTNLVAVADAAIVADKILKALSQPYQIGSERLGCGVSIGIAFYPRDGRDAEELIKRSDLAMYEVKRAGRGGYHYVDDPICEKTTPDIEGVCAVHRALGGDELALYWRPVRACQGAGLVALTGLLRWRNLGHDMPDGGDCAATTAEAAFCTALAEWMLREVRRGQRSLEGGLPALPPVLIGLSVPLFCDARLPERFAAILAEEGAGSGPIAVAVREGDVQLDLEGACAAAVRWQAHGLLVALVQYGTDLTAGVPLRTFKPALLCLDEAWLAAAGTPETAARLAVVTASAHALAIPVIATGVTSASERALVTACGCDGYEGDAAGVPLPIGACEAWFPAAAKTDRWQGPPS